MDSPYFTQKDHIPVIVICSQFKPSSLKQTHCPIPLQNRPHSNRELSPHIWIDISGHARRPTSLRCKKIRYSCEKFDEDGPLFCSPMLNQWFSPSAKFSLTSTNFTLTPTSPGVSCPINKNTVDLLLVQCLFLREEVCCAASKRDYYIGFTTTVTKRTLRIEYTEVKLAFLLSEARTAPFHLFKMRARSASSTKS